MSDKRSVFQALGTDPKKELEGITVTYENGDVSINVKLARAGGANNAFRVAAEKATRGFRRSGVDVARLPHETQAAMTRKLYIGNVILGWEGVYGDDGQSIPFTPDNADEVFKALPDFLDFVVAEANNFQNFRIAARETETGN